MRGHEEVAEWRKKFNRAPAMIFIDDFSHKPGKWFSQEQVNMAQCPRVIIDGDFIAGLDLRFAYGAIVHGTGANERRAKSLFRRLQTFHPEVCAVVVKGTPTGWIGVYTKEKGVICE